MAPSMFCIASIALVAPFLGVSAVPAQAASGCVSLTATEAQTIAEWATLRPTAEKKWGAAPYNVVANDPDTNQPRSATASQRAGCGSNISKRSKGIINEGALNMDSVLPKDADRKVGVLPAPPPTSAVLPGSTPAAAPAA
ncbi:hypothetical protein C8R43DRAFT_941077 [Mycena crocata]|nr:hypothetical protein C8R43DRAFT_941077 [Mycena crocata]